MEAIMASQDEEMGEVTLRVPILKITQSTTKEVKAGDVEAGEFLNTLTGETYGNAVEFIVAYYQQGRSAAHEDGRYFVAIATDIIPEAWKDLPFIGEEFVGTRFDEHPDAEEQYKADVNAGVKEWGKGPKISTTYNYTGIALPSSLEGEEEAEPMPVRVTFLRSTKSAHDKLMTLKKATMRNKAFWDRVFTLSTKVKTFGRNDSYIVEVKNGRPTTDEEKGLAFEVAQAIVAGRVADNAESAEAASTSEAPVAKGALDV
jgi:hypothetical protein